MVSRRQNPDREMDNGEAHGGADGAGKPQVQEPQHTQGSNQGSGEGRRHQEEGPREAEIPESLRAGPRGGSGSTNPFVSARLSGHNTAAGAEGVVNPWSAEEKSVPNADATGPSTSGLEKGELLLVLLQTRATLRLGKHRLTYCRPKRSQATLKSQYCGAEYQSLGGASGAENSSRA